MEHTLTMKHIERLKAHKELFAKLENAEQQSRSGEKGITHTQMMKKLHKRIHETKI